MRIATWFAPLLIPIILVDAGVALAQSCDNQLLTNGGFEAAVVAGDIPGWVEVGGDWRAGTTNPPPSGGTQYLAAGSAATAELNQDVDVTAFAGSGIYYSFSGVVRTGVESPSDEVRVVVEFRGTGGTPLLGSVDSSNLSSPTQWRFPYCLLCHVIETPAGTRVIRIRLIATRLTGSTNDGYFDSFSLIALCPDPVEASTWGRLKMIFD